MGISTKQNLQAFKGNPLVSTAAFLDSRVLMNKAKIKKNEKHVSRFL